MILLVDSASAAAVRETKDPAAIAALERVLAIQEQWRSAPSSISSADWVRAHADLGAEVRRLSNLK